MLSPDALPKAFDAAEAEARWSAYWQLHRLHEAEPTTAAPAYVIAIPPPNVTGVLHMGHMLNNTIQDVLVRRKRQQSLNALWVAGTDHASIATEAKVVQLLRTEGTTKAELGRERFLERAVEWKNKYGGIILGQLERLGASIDNRRTAYTLESPNDPQNGVDRGPDHDYYQAVIDVFVDLYRDGLIYRAKRMVNWDPAAQTTVSDEEVIYLERTDPLVTVRYSVVDANGKDTGETIEVATTRPETIPADQAIAVAPNHPKFARLVGQRVRIPLLDLLIPIFEDEDVDPEFGTGALKITPAHDKLDYAIGKRHGLVLDYDVLNPDGTLNEKSFLYAGLDRVEARKRSIELLREAGHLVKEERHTHNVGTSERTGAVIEPRLTEQWFVDMKALAAPALEAVLDGRVTLVPDKFVGTYRHWMENVQDWCISRQLWWGHRIPAWRVPFPVMRWRSNSKSRHDKEALSIDNPSPYNIIARNVEEATELTLQILEDTLRADSDKKSEFEYKYVDTNSAILSHAEISYFVNKQNYDERSGFLMPEVRNQLSKRVKQVFEENRDGHQQLQDPDVLDTWFSSWLWPIAIFDASVFVKQADGKYPTGNADLRAFYPTATLVTAPEILFFWVARMIMAGLRYRREVPFRHVYLTGIVRDKQGRKMSKSLGNSPEPLELMAKYSTDGVRVGMLFSSPAGNDLLFDESLCEQGRNFSNKIWNALRLVAGWGTSLSDSAPTPVQLLTQRWMDARIAQVSAELAQQLDSFRLSEALMTIYKLIWDDFCAWYLELLKPTLTDGQPEPLPREVFEGAVCSFEQLMVLLHPFMPFLTEEIWHTLAPRAEGASIGRASLPTPQASDAAALITEQMALVRQLATELRALRNSRALSMREPLPLVIKTSDREFFEAYLPLIRRFAGLGEWTYSDAAPAGSATLMLKAHEIFAVLPAGDTSAERARLTEEISYAEGFLQSVSAKLSNEKFVANAKPDVLAREQQKRADAEAKLAALRASLASLG